MEVVNSILEKSSLEFSKINEAISVNKHLDVEYDLGALLVADTNELNKNAIRTKQNDYLLRLTRDNVQLLFNQIWELPTERIEEAIVAKLPPMKTLLPRFKPVPKPRSLTKWQQFAKDKGIQKKKKSKLSWDEQMKKWVPLYGFKRAQAEKEKDWVLEVPANADPFEDQFAKKAAAKTENVAKNELQRLRNIAKARNVKVPRMGLMNPDISSAKSLQAAVTVAKASTASVGKFQSRLPQEKEAKDVASITPGASRKRKLPPVSGAQEKSENLNIVDSVLNKRPKIDIEKAVARHINTEQLERSDEKVSENYSKTRSGGGKKKNSFKSSSSRKPKGGQGQRKKGKAVGGRKRR